MSTSPVRVRFAPSPTGFFHIGSARTALFNWLYARHTGGTFILRIEDTDKERNTAEALRVLLDGMRWLGLDWDEGPEKGGPCAPYFQSERGAIYREYRERLFAAGRAYEKDGAVYFKLLGERYQAWDDHKQKHIEKVKNAPAVIEDAVRGRVEREVDEDFVIFRANGDPVFHFVNVVDDITMKISHVIRGEDHLSNTPRHVELFKAFGAPAPVYAHIPLILKTHGAGKMSKRDQGALIEEYQQKHYLPEAVRNYLCLLGWSPKDDREILPIEEIVRLFDLPGINQTNARFDEKKMAHINMVYVRQMPADALVKTGAEILKLAGLVKAETPAEYMAAVLTLCQEKIRALDELPHFCGYFFREDYPLEAGVVEKLKKNGDPAARLRELCEALAAQEDFSETALEAKVKELAEKHAVKTADYIHAARFALSGMSVGPSFYGMLRVLGKERVTARLERFISANRS
ncbi:MAG: glutamate--tRNA ligase family protein [Opitutales bacterium]|jgi:glutamyl-tRNA synthetase